MNSRDAAKITHKQTRYIFLCAKKLGLDMKLLHDVVFATTHRQSISDLTVREAGDVIDVLAREAFPNAPKQQRKNVIYLVSSEQIDMALFLTTRMGWDEQRMDKLALKMYRRPLRQLTARQAGGLIEALKSILSRTEKNQEGRHV